MQQHEPLPSDFHTDTPEALHFILIAVGMRKVREETELAAQSELYKVIFRNMNIHLTMKAEIIIILNTQLYYSIIL